MKSIPYGRQWIDEDDVAAVVEVLRSDFLTQGPAVERFEAGLAQACDAPHAVAVSNGTAALHLAALALDLGPEDRLWTSPNTFVASANCARYCGATVDFVDIDSGTGNLCPNKLETKLRESARKNQLPKVVVPVHFAGQSCDLPAISSLAEEFGFKIIEDASHALGGTFDDEPVGSGKWSDLVTHSFHPVKIITSGEGGAVTTQHRELAERIRLLRTHGITRDPALLTENDPGAWYYEQQNLGFNYRLSDLQAALGASQLGKLREFSARRAALAACWDSVLEDLPVTPLARDPRVRSGWHLYVIRIDQTKTRCTRRQVFDFLRAHGVGVQVHYIPVHLQPDFQRLGFYEGQFPEAERYYTECLSLPLYPALSEAELLNVRDILAAALV